MKKILLYLAVFSTGAVFTGCGLNSKASYTVNPDLSAKCVFEQKVGLDMAVVSTYYSGILSNKGSDMSGLSSMMGDTDNPSPHDIMLRFADKILSNPGVEAWKDIDLHLIGNDTIYFKGTAYFKNISKGGLSSMDSGIHIYNNDMGQTVISLNEDKKDTGTSPYSSIYKNMFKGGVYYSMMHYYMAAIVRDMDISLTYHLPGKIISYSNFVKIDDNTALLAFNGKNMMHNLDSIMQKSDWLSKMYSNPTAMGKSSNALLFGENNPVQVIYQAGNKPLFDYDKEVASAKKEYAAFRKKSGIDVMDSISRMKTEMAEAEKKKQEGTLVLTASDSADGKTYIKDLTVSQYYRNYLSFSGTLSKPVTASYGTVYLFSAKTDNGTDVLDSIQGHEDISAYISSASYSDTTGGNTKVSFSVNGTFPDDCKFINLKGELRMDSEPSVHFKMINLYLNPKKDSYSYGNEK